MMLYDRRNCENTYGNSPNINHHQQTWCAFNFRVSAEWDNIRGDNEYDGRQSESSSYFFN